MKRSKPMTWKGAVCESPGPRTLKDFMILMCKGIFMGVAHIIPGVSGGTIALITGIYLDLLDAIKSVNTVFFRQLLTFDIKGAVSVLHLRFLSAVFLGTLLSIISLAQIASYLLVHQPVATGAFFFGLIIASAFVVGKDIHHWLGTGGVSFVVGAVGAYFIVGMIPVSTPETLWFVFFSGFISICAMILPGLSGAFILLILGKYAYIVDSLKNPFVPENLLIILIFCMGCVAGLAAFSRILSFLLKRFYNATLAALTGLMIGSLRKIWPWKSVLETKEIHGKVYVVSEKVVLPSEFSMEFVVAICLCLAGFVFIVVLEQATSKHTNNEAGSAV